MDRLIDLNSIPVQATLQILLKDKTTKKNIIWATNTYKDLGAGFQDTDEITERRIFGLNDRILQPRASKSLEEQKERTRIKAEVMTPSWLCNKMNNYADEDWFGYQNVFNTAGNNTWQISKGRIEFPEGREWQDYIDSRRIEITCGEAPFLVSRYDTVTGEFIEPPTQRIGLLDRKLRVVGENTSDYDTWLKWAIRAFQSCYGYEYQGDSLLIARINMLMSFCDYHEARWNKSPDAVLLRKIANIIAWNLWQMDGLKGTTPLGAHYEEFHQLSLWEDPQQIQAAEKNNLTELPCVINRWRSHSSLRWEESIMSKKFFDLCIGNPPYQGANDKNGRQPPVYHQFMDASYQVAKCVELITPARFLFNGGQTPKAWNKKMLSNEHFKVLEYEPDASNVFPNTEIKGGVAITVLDFSKNYGAINIFTPYPALNSILCKVKPDADESLMSICVGAVPYHFTEQLRTEHPEYLDMIGESFDLRTNILDKLSEKLFFDNKPKDGKEYVKIFGLHNKVRTSMWINTQYITKAINFEMYKVFIPKAFGSGQFGELMPQMEIGSPKVGQTQSFVSIGNLQTIKEAENLRKYLQCKLTRSLLGILKTTQDITPEKWKYVPLQDFAEKSCIDWSKPISDIDQQLYRKYGLDETEVNFIESHIKEMS